MYMHCGKRRPRRTAKEGDDEKSEGKPAIKPLTWPTEFHVLATLLYSQRVAPKPQGRSVTPTDPMGSNKKIYSQITSTLLYATTLFFPKHYDNIGLK